MGGLVARSACVHAMAQNLDWRHRLGRIVFLGTPHLGAPLERAGGWVDQALGVSPYTAPLAALGAVRSAGIKDLRHGRIGRGDTRRKSPASDIAELPPQARRFMIAASLSQSPDLPDARLRGDGLVPVASALGRHRDAARALSTPPAQQAICRGLNHFDLLGRTQVYAHLLRWLA
jgi:hypothetical protein